MRQHPTDRAKTLIGILRSYGVDAPLLAYDSAGAVASMSWDKGPMYVVLEIKGDLILLFSYNKVTKARRFLELRVVDDFQAVDKIWTTKHLSAFMAHDIPVPIPQEATLWSRIMNFFFNSEVQ